MIRWRVWRSWSGLAALVLTAGELPRGSLSGWSVVSVSIPKEGEIRDAYVELKSPAGRVVTVTRGVTTTEGVTLERIDWAGSPIHAVVTLRKGSERAELAVKAGLVSKNNELIRASAQVEIEAKFMEIPDALAREFKLTGQTDASDRVPGPALPAGPALAKVLDEDQAAALFPKLVGTRGIDLLSVPRVTTLSHQRAVVEIIREFRYPTEYGRKKGEPVVATAFETRNCGVTLDVEPALWEDGTVELKVTPEVVEFLGFISYPSGEALPLKREPGQRFIDRITAPLEPDKPYAGGEIRQPVFSSRKTVSDLTIKSGQTAVLIGPAAAEVKGFELPSAGKQLVVFVRASIVHPAETVSASTPAVTQPPAPGPALGKPEIPVGTPVQGKR